MGTVRSDETMDENELMSSMKVSQALRFFRYDVMI